MSSIKLDINGDIDITGNTMNLVAGREERKQHVTQRLKIFQSEYFLDDRNGTPWYLILGKGSNSDIIDSLLKSRILQTPGFINLLKFSLDINNVTRKLSINFSARTVDGEVYFSETLP